LPNEPMLLDKKNRFFELNVSVCPILRLPIHYSIIKSRWIYYALFHLIEKIKYLNFVFHLYDFVNVDHEKIKAVLNIIIPQRRLVLSKYINNLYGLIN
jgi:hypothetical protein